MQWIVNAGLPFELTLGGGAENTVPNFYKTWIDINAGLPDVKIEVLGPPMSSGTREAFVEPAGSDSPPGSPCWCWCH